MQSNEANMVLLKKPAKKQKNHSLFLFLTEIKILIFIFWSKLKGIERILLKIFIYLFIY